MIARILLRLRRPTGWMIAVDHAGLRTIRPAPRVYCDRRLPGNHAGNGRIMEG